MDPSDIDAELIRRHADPLELLFEFVNEFVAEHGESAFGMLSIDFQRLAWISDLDGKINNAGLRDYLADRTDEVTGRVDSSVGEAIAALREFGAVQSADVCSKALEQWERFASAMNDAARKGKAIEFRDIAESCHELDVRYWGAQKNMYERLRHYLRENASRFVPRK